MTNLNNYVNLYPGSAESKSLGNVTIAPFGSGSGFLGIPGDVTPFPLYPCRFLPDFYTATEYRTGNRSPMFSDTE